MKMVLAGQAASNSFIPAGMNYLQSTYGQANSYVDAIAIAPYIDIPAAADTAGLTLDGLFAALNTQLDTEVTGWIKNHSKVATQFGVKLMAYEGGQGLTPSTNGSVNAALKLQAQYDTRMGNLTKKLLNIWAENGGDIFNYYSFIARDANSGYWGVLPSMSEPGSPKWDALLQASLPIGDATLDGIISDADYQVLWANFNQSGKWWEQGDFNADGIVNIDDLVLLDWSYAHQRDPGTLDDHFTTAVITPEPAISLSRTGVGRSRNLPTPWPQTYRLNVHLNICFTIVPQGLAPIPEGLAGEADVVGGFGDAVRRAAGRLRADPLPVVARDGLDRVPLPPVTRIES